MLLIVGKLGEADAFLIFGWNVAAAKWYKQDEVGAAILSLKRRRIVFKCNCVLGEIGVVGEFNCII